MSTDFFLPHTYINAYLQQYNAVDLATQQRTLTFRSGSLKKQDCPNAVQPPLEAELKEEEAITNYHFPRIKQLFFLPSRLDINECQLPRPPCAKYLCENTIGGYKCAGKPGKPFEEAVPGSARVTTEASATSAMPRTDICPPGFRAGDDDECLGKFLLLDIT